MSQLVPYHLFNGEQDESLMFATMFDYQNEYSKPVMLTNIVFEQNIFYEFYMMQYEEMRILTRLARNQIHVNGAN
ncbi:unnamed protein product [Pieris macdunnoughi]|uniref:Uncharacterized protein n=1 Tax=Pieris macdunnoughi TaxID=345717 RepID=A0A821VMZ9_9NEOP|nr:unnamed protein product [Pieris macdunnoughi]